ncbi:DnaJ domain protein [Ceratobasidium sp. AG-Ba]|nr:DnaJ domain protein [Ceratobasidium sp. AG-Ba]
MEAVTQPLAAMSTEQTNYYSLLGLSKDAGAPAIKQAYRAALLRAHPDKHTQLWGQKLAVPAVAVTQLQEAFRTLSDPKLRKAYDQLLEEGKGKVTLTAVVQRPAHEVSLDEFIEDEITKDDGDVTSMWSYVCRCGGRFIIEEEQLEDGIHYVGCNGCSEVVWVGYEEVDDTQNQEHDSSKT